MQAVIMLTGLVVVCALGMHQVGGSMVVFNTAKELGRINFNKFVITLYNLYLIKHNSRITILPDLWAKFVDLGSIY